MNEELKLEPQAMPQGNGLSLWKFNDCEYVAALTKEEAIAWYEKEIHGESVDHEYDIDDADLDDKVDVSEEGQPRNLVTWRAAIQTLLDEGQKPPFVVGYDASAV